MTKLKEGTLSSEPKELAELALKLYSNISYWENNEKRITSQKVIKINTDNTNKIVAAILPQTIVAGTITRRAVESTWLTASNYKVSINLKYVLNKISFSYSKERSNWWRIKNNGSMSRWVCVCRC